MGSRGHIGEPHFVSDFGEFPELIGVPVTFDREMVEARLQVLADGDHIHLMRPEVLEHRNHLFTVLSKGPA